MSSRPLLVVAWLALGLAACGAWTELEDVECPPEGTELTYEGFAEGFFIKNCNSCHAASAEDRNGAPIAYVFDTYDQVVSLKDRVFLRAAADNATMPPGPDDPSQDERDALAEWIACGAPAE
jgi:uncharacterized membrane protein